MQASEQVIPVNGARLWVATQGSGDPMVLCSGGPGCCDYLDPVASMIDDLVRVCRYDARGCGRSSDAGPYDVQTSVDDLEALRAHFGHERWVVGGHSWGAFLALAYALDHPAHTAAVVYLAGTGVQDDRQWHDAYEAGRAARRERDPDFAFPPNLDVNRAANASTREYIKQPSLLRRLADLEVPMLALSGSEDIRPVWPVLQLVNLLPYARLEMIEGAGHTMWLTHPDELRSRLRAFVLERRTTGAP